MSWLNEVSALLAKYSQNATPQFGPDVETHFGQVASAAPQSELSSGIGEAFRSDSTPPFADMIAQLFGHSNPNQKVGSINMLLSALGPSAAGILERMGLGRVNQLDVDQTGSIDTNNVQEIAAQAEKSDPSIMDRAADFYAQHPSLVKNLGSAALAIVLARIAKNNRAM